MDLSVPDVYKSILTLNSDWKEFYGCVVEEEPHQIPEPLERLLYVGCFVDAGHGGNVITNRLHCGILLFVNNTLIKSFIKRQNTVESSMFDSDIVALRIARDMIMDIRIKLKLLGFPSPVQRMYSVIAMMLWITQASTNLPFLRSTIQSTTTMCVRHPQRGLCTLGRKAWQRI